MKCFVSKLEIIDDFLKEIMNHYPEILRYNLVSKQSSTAHSNENKICITFNIVNDDIGYRPYYRVEIYNDNYIHSYFEHNHRDYEKHLVREFHGEKYIDTLDRLLTVETDKLKERIMST